MEKEQDREKNEVQMELLLFIICFPVFVVRIFLPILNILLKTD